MPAFSLFALAFFLCCIVSYNDVNVSAVFVCGSIYDNVLLSSWIAGHNRRKLGFDSVGNTPLMAHQSGDTQRGGAVATLLQWYGQWSFVSDIVLCSRFHQIVYKGSCIVPYPSSIHRVHLSNRHRHNATGGVRSSRHTTPNKRTVPFSEFSGHTPSILFIIFTTLRIPFICLLYNYGQRLFGICNRQEKVPDC